MGKKKKFSKQKEANRSNNTRNDCDSTVDPSSRNYIYDEVDDFHDRDDYEYLSSQKHIFEDDDAQEQVLGIGGLSSDEDDASDVSESSVPDNDDELFEDGIESKTADKNNTFDERLMGRRKRDYFGTDIPDQKIHNKARQRSKGESLTVIEDQARKLQERMAAQLTGLSYSHLLPQEDKVETEPKEKSEMEFIATNSNLSNKSLKHLQKKSPELLFTINDLKEKCQELKDVLAPLMQAKKEGLLSSSSCVEYLQIRYLLSLNYATVVSSYLAIRNSESYSPDHPVVSRLGQFRHLYKELEICQRKFEPELISLLEDLNAGKLKKSSGRKMLNIVNKKVIENKKRSHKPSESSEDNEEQNAAYLENNHSSDISDKMSSDEDEEEEDSIKKSNLGTSFKTLSTNDRRRISYTIEKNKGLMPSRKKEQRNPRVKYKNKYQKKLKRRKGQVREVRKEIQRYGGEISGIKANLVKSRKLQ